MVDIKKAILAPLIVLGSVYLVASLMFGGWVLLLFGTGDITITTFFLSNRYSTYDKVAAIIGIGLYIIGFITLCFFVYVRLSGGEK